MARLELGPIARYAAELGRPESPPERGAAGGLRRLVRRLVAPRPRKFAQSQLTRFLVPYSRLRARRITGAAPLRLHLGCGANRLAGWINVDLVGSGADFAWHLGRPLPFPDGSCRAVFSEHLLEHLDLEAALTLIARTWRLLRPGGVLRCGVPDFGRYASSYCGADDLIELYRPDRPTPLLALSEVAYLHGHRSLWDAETLVAALVEAGFSDVSARPFGESAIDPTPDSPRRRVETLYVEGVR